MKGYSIIKKKCFYKIFDIICNWLVNYENDVE